MSFIKLFADDELGSVEQLKGSFRGQFNDNFVHMILSDDYLFMVEPEGLAGDAYTVIKRVSFENLGEIEKIGDKDLKMTINGKKNRFASVMKADIIIKSISEIKKVKNSNS
jgi:hypothetical protein